MLWLRRRLIIWAAVGLGLPLAARGLHRLAEEVEGRRGPSPATQRLHQAGAVTDRVQQTLNRRSRKERRRGRGGRRPAE